MAWGAWGQARGGPVGALTLTALAEGIQANQGQTPGRSALGRQSGRGLEPESDPKSVGAVPAPVCEAPEGPCQVSGKGDCRDHMKEDGVAGEDSWESQGHLAHPTPALGPPELPGGGGPCGPGSLHRSLPAGGRLCGDSGNSAHTVLSSGGPGRASGGAGEPSPPPWPQLLLLSSKVGARLHLPAGVWP